jgi:hypothetical protein
LYATQLLYILFTHEEIRKGCVEPRNTNGKKEVLDQEKIIFLKKQVAFKVAFVIISLSLFKLVINKKQMVIYVRILDRLFVN